MKQHFLTFTLFTLCLICNLSCNNKNEQYMDDIAERLKKTEPEYDSEQQSIIYRELMKYDIKGNIAVPININKSNLCDFLCEFSFFNYGDDIRLLNGYREDLFVTRLGTINYIRVLKKEDRIDFVSKAHNKKYGEWALVNIAIENYNIKDVFMTPLAMKAYKDGDDDSYIFIQFDACNKYMNVIFYGSPKDCIVINSCSEYILRNVDPICDFDALLNGPGTFWHQKNISAE